MSLPVEIYSDIVRHISTRDDLRSLLYTSRILRHEAERILLRSIDLTSPLIFNEDKNQLKRKRLTEAFARIARNPDLALAVHEVHYCTGVVPDQLIQEVFPLMTNLSRLYLSTAFPPMFRYCNFRLKFLSCRYTVPANEVSELLSTQSSITELQLSLTIYILPDSLPKLDVFFCSDARQAARVLSGRRITRLRVGGGYNLSNSDLSDRNSLAHLRVLFCMGVEQGFDWSLLRNLEYLSIFDTKTIASWINYLPKLRKLHLWVYTRGRGRGEFDAQAALSEFTPRALALFQINSHLQSISFENQISPGNNGVAKFFRNYTPKVDKGRDPEDWTAFELEG